jgi:hypothetical protein
MLYVVAGESAGNAAAIYGAPPAGVACGVGSGDGAAVYAPTGIAAPDDDCMDSTPVPYVVVIDPLIIKYAIEAGTSVAAGSG